MRFRLFLFLILFSSPVFAKVSVVSTDRILSSLFSEIGGSRVSSRALLNQSQELHDVQLTPHMFRILSRADIVVVYGLSLDSFVPTSSLSRAMVIDLSKRLPEASFSHSHSDFVNPHYIYSLKNLSLSARQACDVLSFYDPKGKLYYEKRTNLFLSKLDLLQRSLPSDSHLSVVTYHEVFEYLLEELGVTHVGSFEPRPGFSIPPSELNFLLSQMSSGKVDFILTSVYFNSEYLRSVSQKYHLKLLSLPTMPLNTQSLIEYYSFLYHSVLSIKPKI